MDITLAKIIQSSFHFFMTYGVRSVTMDDLARELRISKKTLYQYVANKADLVKLVAEYYLEQENIHLLAVQQREGNAIEEMFDIAGYVSLQLSKINLAAIYDFRKYYPEIWADIEDKRTEMITQMMRKNLERGISEGLYRADINAQVLIRLYLAATRSFAEDDYYQLNNYLPTDVFRELFKYHIYGIASNSGIAYLQQNLDKFKKTIYASIAR